MGLNLNEIFSIEFLKKPFPEKRNLLNEFHLKSKIQYVESSDNIEYEYNFKVGDSVLCFEDKNADNEGSGYRWYMSGITVNHFYEVLEIKDGKDLLIKIMGDTGRRSWVQANRFLIGSIVMECFKWYKNDRICYICNHEEECRYEYALYQFIDNFHCEYQDVYYGSVTFPKCSKNDEGYVKYEDKEYCIGVKECKSKEIVHNS